MNKAFGKIILIGEHSVVYNKPAIAIPFKTMQVDTKILKDDTLSIDSIYYQGDLKHAPANLENLKAVILKSLEIINPKDQNFKIVIESNIPAERGVGSSAAVANSITKAIFNYFNYPLDKELLFELAQISETIAHGNPSGLDAMTTVSDKPLYYIKNQEIESFNINCNGYLVVADTGEKGQTKLAVGELAKLKADNPQLVEGLMDHLEQLAISAKTYLINDLPVQLGRVMNKAHDILKQLQVSNSALDNLVESALENSALGAKLTGGGKGGCMIALAKDQKSAENISKALLASGAKNTWIMELNNG